MMPAHVSTDWSYGFDPPSVSSQPYWFQVRAYDAAGKMSNTITGGFTLQLDAQDPVLVVDVPTNGAVVEASSLVFEGSATDDVGVTRVALAVYDRDLSQYWDGSGWQSGYRTVDAVLDAAGAVSTDWSYGFVPPSVSSQPYWFQVRAYDAAGKMSNTITGGFTLVAAAPLTAVVPGVAVEAPDEWVAYNDMNTLAGDENPANVTLIEYGTTGALIDYASGIELPVTVSATTTTPGGADQYADGGPTDSGTEAHALFDGIVDLTGSDRLASGESSTLTFAGLDPEKTYAVTLSANRDDPASAENQYARVAIAGAEAAVGASSDNVISNPDGSVSFSVGDNSANGTIVRWIAIDPGADGVFTVTSSWDETQGSIAAGTAPNTHGYAMTAFKLETFVDVSAPVGINRDTAGGRGRPLPSRNRGHVIGQCGCASRLRSRFWT